MTEMKPGEIAAPPLKYIDLDGLRKKLAWRSPSAIHRDVRDGKLPQPLKMGVRRYWLEAEVDEALRALHEKQRDNGNPANTQLVG